MTNTDEKLAFSNETAINCFILAASYVGARAMFAGNIIGIEKVVTSNYGAVMNPAIAIGIQMASLLNLGFDAWHSVYLYPVANKKCLLSMILLQMMMYLSQVNL